MGRGKEGECDQLCRKLNSHFLYWMNYNWDLKLLQCGVLKKSVQGSNLPCIFIELLFNRTYFSLPPSFPPPQQLVSTLWTLSMFSPHWDVLRSHCPHLFAKYILYYWNIRISTACWKLALEWLVLLCLPKGLYIENEFALNMCAEFKVLFRHTHSKIPHDNGQRRRNGSRNCNRDAKKVAKEAQVPTARAQGQSWPPPYNQMAKQEKVKCYTTVLYSAGKQRYPTSRSWHWWSCGPLPFSSVGKRKAIVCMPPLEDR